MVRSLGRAAIMLAMGTVACAPALAADGCGPGGYRNSLFGHCHWAGPPAPPPPPRGYYEPSPAYAPGPAHYGGPGYGPVIVDRWYPGHGYWDGRRYWWHRRHWVGGWRYY